MASDVMSLFGLDPNTIQQNRTNKAVSQASAMNPYFAAGAAGGALMGQSVNSMFGLQTPDMAQAQGVQDSMEGADLSTPAGMRQAARQLMMNGDYAQAMALHSRANEMEAAGTEATNLAQDRSLGKSRNVITQEAVPANATTGMGGSAAVYRSITEYPDGSVADATSGKMFKDYAEWMAAVHSGAVAVVSTGGDSKFDYVDGKLVPIGGASEPKAVEPVLNEEQQQSIVRLQESLEITDPNSEQAVQIQKTIDNIVASGEEAGAVADVKKKAQLAYYSNNIREAQKIINSYTKSDGTLLGTSRVGSAQQTLRNALEQIYNLTGKDYSPEDYPVETPNK
tara:strand:- start:5816 stop:6829 length:1014 start_codon:yes stop_codon:yes gene_type:complete